MGRRPRRTSRLNNSAPAWNCAQLSVGAPRLQRRRGSYPNRESAGLLIKGEEMTQPNSARLPNGGALRWLLPSVLLALALPAWASLGDSVTTVQKDKAHMKGTLRSVAT